VVPRQPVSLVVPLYDEAYRLAQFAPALTAFVLRCAEGSQLLLVDDGSTDGTASVAESIAAAQPAGLVRTLTLPHRGKGAAVRAGLGEVVTPMAAFCDVDLATPLDDLARLLVEAERENALVIGSRDVAASKIVRHESPIRESLGRLFNVAVRLLAVPGIRDTQCGAKAAPTALWRQIAGPSLEDGFAWDVEVLAIARARGLDVIERGVTWSHDDRSRVHVGRDGLRMLAALPRIVLRSRRVRHGDTADTEGASGGGVFVDRAADGLAANDAEHWWFQAKARLVSAAIRQYRPPRGLLVDLGAGAGGVTAALDWPHEDKIAVEGNEELAQTIRDRHGLRAVAADIHAVPLESRSASVVCLLDVIEHLDDPEVVLREARRLLAPGGLVVVTVPAHEWLWSAADTELGHARRYTRTRMRLDLDQSGLEPLTITHVFSWLLPPVWLRRRLTRRDQADLGLETQSAAIDRAAALLSGIEARIVQRTWLPAGTSVLSVAVARDQGASVR